MQSVRVLNFKESKLSRNSCILLAMIECCSLYFSLVFVILSVSLFLLRVLHALIFNISHFKFDITSVKNNLKVSTVFWPLLLHYCQSTCRGSRTEVSCKKGVRKIFASFRKTPVLELLFQ